jgi:hypothetical protein
MISPKNKSKLSVNDLGKKGTFRTIEQMREFACNIQFNDMSLPPDEREVINKLFEDILGV